MRCGKMDTILQCGMVAVLIFLLFEFSNCQKQEQQQNPFQLFQKYHEAVQSVKNQDERINNIYIKMLETNSNTEQFLEEIQEQEQNFNRVSKKYFESIVWQEPIQKTAQDILNISSNFNIRSKFIESTKKVQEASKNYCQITQVLYEQNKQFDQLLQILQKLEKNVTDIQKDLYAITQFNIISDYTSLEYINPIQIFENQFVELLDTGTVKKVVLNLESKRDFQINKKTTIIQGLHVKHAQKGDGLEYIRFIFQDKCQKLIIKDAKFLGVGLYIIGVADGANEVYIDNFSVQNSHVQGLYVHYCDTCKIENVLVQNSTYQGMEFHQVNNCTVDDATVLGAGGYGIYFSNYKAVVQNSFIKNSTKYGIYVNAGQVTGQNVTFDGNANGNTTGNYITQ